MSFKCQLCGVKVVNHTSPIRKLIETRKRYYEYPDEKGNIKTTYGWEIVKEVVICEKCSKL